jgi:hypothetical protein
MFRLVSRSRVRKSEVAVSQSLERYAVAAEQILKWRLYHVRDGLARRLYSALKSRAEGAQCVLMVGLRCDPAGRAPKVSFAPYADSQVNSEIRNLLQTVEPPLDVLRHVVVPVHISLDEFPDSKFAHAYPMN